MRDGLAAVGGPERDGSADRGGRLLQLVVFHTADRPGPAEVTRRLELQDRDPVILVQRLVGLRENYSSRIKI